jgi:hypothetical protein
MCDDERANNHRMARPVAPDDPDRIAAMIDDTASGIERSCSARHDAGALRGSSKTPGGT